MDLLLIFRSELGRRLDPGNGQDRGVVELGVIQPVDEVQAAWARGRQADPEAPGRLRVAGRHERGRLFVMDQEEPDPVLVTAKPLHDAVDAIAGKAEYRIHAPIGEPLD